LGNSGLRVSEAALGAMTFGEDWGWGADKEEARKVYDAFREVGGNFFDTANVYTNGSSESFLGEFMQGVRQSVVLFPHDLYPRSAMITYGGMRDQIIA
jgi:aryl-alcohol dehydrogenase-like predicted oxidoreductase